MMAPACVMASDAEVGEFDLDRPHQSVVTIDAGTGIAGEQNVFWFDVSLDDAPLVRIDQRPGHIGSDRKCLLFGQWGDFRQPPVHFACSLAIKNFVIEPYVLSSCPG